MVESRGPAIYVICIVFPIISAIFVALRLYTRGFITKSLALNDYVAFATMFPIVAYSVLLAQATKNGMGQHIYDFTPEQESHMYFWIMVSSEFYVLSLAGFKTALLLLYIQLFGVNQKFRWICYAVLFYVLGFALSNLITEVGGCHPIQKFWKPKTPGHCIDDVAADIAYGFSYMSGDLMIAILPLPMIWKLKLVNAKEKLGLALVLTSGGIAFVVSAARWIVSTVDLVSYDRTWIAGAAFALSIVEVNTGLICGCTPALKPLFITVRRASIDWSASRKRSFDTEEAAGLPNPSGEGRGSLDKPLPQLPELGARLSNMRLEAGGTPLRAEMGSGASRHEMIVDAAARHELETQQLGMVDHDAYAGQDDITKASPGEKSSSGSGSD